MPWKRIGLVTLSAVLISLILCFLAGLFVRNIGNFVTLLGPDLGLKKREIQQYSAVFGQLRSANLRFPVIPGLVLSGVSAWLVSAIRCKKAADRIPLQILLSLVLILILFIITLLLMDVNTIRFANALLYLMTLLTQ